jgi:2-keto-4-pentenoate hydratase/2-oxohepta-3-ene-1,7-dioic acid hydratase in catechol pathway
MADMAFRLARLGDAGHERPYALLDSEAFRLDSLTADIDGAFLADGGVDRARDAVESGHVPSSGDFEALGLRVGPPVAGVGKVVCIGLNYRDHAAETGAALPTEPVIFMKDPGTIVGPCDDVLIPRTSVKTDWEVELAVVIGKTARYLDDDTSALNCVAGYAISNDVSEREFQLERGGQWDKGKSCEPFNPLGPWLVPPGDVADLRALALQLWVNGEVKQDGNTGDMVFGVSEIVRYVSQFMVLRPGDIINTGTPAGVALGQPDPKPYLRAGDVMELAIEGLGRQRQRLVQA